MAKQTKSPRVRKTRYQNAVDNPKALDCDGRPIVLTKVQRRRKGGDGRASWEAPSDMPDWQVLAVLAGHMCGAKLHRAKGYCTVKVHPDENPHGVVPYYCKDHGGPADLGKNGSHRGMKRALQHGLYAQAILDGEEEAFEKIDVESLDEEIKITKLRLARALKKEAEDTLELESESSGYGAEGNSFSNKVYVTARRHVHNIVNQLTKLYAQRAAIQAGPVGNPDKPVVNIYLPDNGRAKGLRE